MQAVNNFNDIQHIPLQAYNRVVMFSNLRKDSGPEAAEEYARQFSQADRTRMYLMISYIKKFGQEAAAKAATIGMVFEDLPEEGKLN